MKDFIATLGGTDAIADAFLAMEFGFVAVFTAAFAVAVTLRLHSEEDSGHAELVLAGAVSRTRWLAAAVVVAVVGSVVLTVVAALATGVVTVARSGSWSDLWSVLGGMTVPLPAVWVLAGIVVLLVGLVPRAAPLAWAVLVGFLLLGELGPLLSLPGWALDLSPFSHVPRLPGAPMSWPPLLWLLLVSAGLLLAGWAGFRRRDVPA
jgi:ABC-2 type transport system permease protein